MAQNFLSCDRAQVLLLPVDMGDWLPEGHFARFVVEAVDELDLAAVYAYYRQDGRGRPAHDPAMMVALVLYAYAVGVTSSRAIERRCVDDVAFRFISANRQPDHATVARFLIRHRDALSDLFFEVLALCQRAGMLNAATVAVDSTKLAANASAGQNRTYEGLRAEAERIIGEAIENDRREDELYGQARGDELPSELADPRTRKTRIKELLEQARQERAEAEAERAEKRAEHDEHLARTGKRKPGRPLKAGVEVNDDQRQLLSRKYNLTDPDSGIVRHRGMLMQGYNVQAVVDQRQIVLGTRVTGVSSDTAQLEPTLRVAEQTLLRLGGPGRLSQVLADSGYWNIAQIQRLQQQGLEVLVPPPAPARRHAEAMRQRLHTPQGRRDYQRRQQIIEPVFAHWKHLRGITRVWRRGKHAVQAEIDLIATSHNLLKLYHATPTLA